mgnify:CR=1 FL=1
MYAVVEHDIDIRWGETSKKLIFVSDNFEGAVDKAKMLSKSNIYKDGRRDECSDDTIGLQCYNEIIRIYYNPKDAPNNRTTLDNVYKYLVVELFSDQVDHSYE